MSETKVYPSPHMRDMKGSYIQGLEDALEALISREDLVAGVVTLRNNIVKEKRKLRKL